MSILKQSCHSLSISTNSTSVYSDGRDSGYISSIPSTAGSESHRAHVNLSGADSCQSGYIHNDHFNAMYGSAVSYTVAEPIHADELNAVGTARNPEGSYIKKIGRTVNSACLNPCGRSDVFRGQIFDSCSCNNFIEPHESRPATNVNRVNRPQSNQSSQIINQSEVPISFTDIGPPPGLVKSERASSFELRSGRSVENDIGRAGSQEPSSGLPMLNQVGRS